MKSSCFKILSTATLYQHFSWENGKLLLTKENFIQELIFYDKDNIPLRIFRELSRLVKDPQFDPWLVMSVSRAASGICQWVHAVQKYSDIHRNMQPRLKNLLEQEEKFTRVIYFVIMHSSLGQNFFIS